MAWMSLATSKWRAATSRAVCMAVQTKLPEGSVCRQSVRDTPFPQTFFPTESVFPKAELFSRSGLDDFPSLPLPGPGERRPGFKFQPGHCYATRRLFSKLHNFSEPQFSHLCSGNLDNIPSPVYFRKMSGSSQEVAAKLRDFIHHNEF